MAAAVPLLIMAAASGGAAYGIGKKMEHNAKQDAKNAPKLPDYQSLLAEAPKDTAMGDEETARRRNRRRAASAGTRRSTLLTGTGLGAAPTERKSLLGS